MFCLEGSGIKLSLKTIKSVFANPTAQNGTSHSSHWLNSSIQRFYLPSQTQVRYRKTFLFDTP